MVRLDGIGDVVMTSPLLRELRRSKPGIRVTLVTDESVRNLVEKCPYVDEVRCVHTYRARGLRWTVGLLQLARFGLKCRRLEEVDLVIAPRWDVETLHNNLLGVLTEARWRVGYSERVSADKVRLNEGYDAFFTHVIDRRTPRHEVESNLDLLKCLGIASSGDGLEMWDQKDDADVIEEMFGPRPANELERLVALVPGAGARRKMWPAEKFTEVGAWLKSEYGVKLVIVGGEEERLVGAELQTRLRQDVVSVAGRVTLRQTTALLRRCMLLVGNDTGAVHMAAAVQTPVVVISACARGANPSLAQSPARFGPWRVPHLVVQPKRARPPCADQCVAGSPHCILDVPVSDVQAAVRELMAGTARGTMAACRGK